jgi:ElaB/YqjD/DUF883 family membrane-anchored ribosome-binding protein
MSNADGENATYERLEKDVADVKMGISVLSGQIADAIKAFTGTDTKPARRGYKQVHDNVDSIKSDSSKRGGTVRDAAEDVAYSIEEALEDVTKQHPLTTVGIALGLGFLIGLTWRR